MEALVIVLLTAFQPDVITTDMPHIDTELVQPLMVISETLLKRPGVVTMHSIKKLSEIYGFSTFVENIKDNTGKPLVRMSISGLVLLIDIDFAVPIDMISALGSPISPGVGNSLNNLDMNNLNNEGIINVSINSAITPDQIDGESWDFLFGFKGFASCSEVLFENLKEKTLDSFNMNLRVLLLFDRLSKEKPNDLFTIFSTLAWVLTKQSEKAFEEKTKLDWNDGILGIGQVLCNQDHKVGVFLQYWIDDRFINRWIRTNKGIDVVDRRYLIHFKVKESLKEGKVKSEGIENIDSYVTVDENGSTNDSDVVMRENDDVLSNDKLHDNLSLITLELSPPVWIPEDILHMLGVKYDTINEENENWSNNKARVGDDKYNTGLDKVYKIANENAGYVEIDNNKDEKLQLEILIGCKLVKVFKMQLSDLCILEQVVNCLRNWCKANNIIRNTIREYQVNLETVNSANTQPDSQETTAPSTVVVDLSDIFTSATEPTMTPVAATATTTTTTTTTNKLRLSLNKDGLLFHIPQNGKTHTETVKRGVVSEPKTEFVEKYYY